MKNCIILTDNSNIFIEGQKLSAEIKGVIKITESEKDPCDPSWRLDFGCLLKAAAENQHIIGAILVGSRPPQGDSIWEAAKRNGFDVTVHNRNAAGKEKAVDTEIVIKAVELILTQSNPGVLKLLSGDGDFLPLIHFANKRGWETEIWTFANAFNCQGEMAKSVLKVKLLDTLFSKIGYNGFHWP
ncbi:MAG TPA: NYN domain-containing protein [Puia sp.]|jgi:uncharacterized LabA/DUF88 family protein